MVRDSWNSLPMAEEIKQVKVLVDRLANCRRDDGVDGVSVVINFLDRQVQPIKERVHPASDYTGRGDPTRESAEPWKESELGVQAASLFQSDVDMLAAERP